MLIPAVLSFSGVAVVFFSGLRMMATNFARKDYRLFSSATLMIAISMMMFLTSLYFISMSGLEGARTYHISSGK